MAGERRNPLTVALIGCGRWGRLILRDLRALGCEVVVIDPSSEGVQHAHDGGAVRMADRIDEIRDVDGVVVATPASSHAEVVRAVLSLEVPIYVEKPITVDPDQAERLARAAPSTLFVMDKWRYHPAVGVLRDIATGGELGAVTGLATRREQWGNPHPDTDPVWTLAPHDLVIAHEILGDLPEPRSAVLERSNGATLGMTAILGAEPWVALSVSGARPETHRSVHAFFEDGVAWFEGGWADHVLVARAESVAGEPERREATGELPLLAELRAFVGHLRGGPPPLSDAATGARVVRMIADLRGLAAEPGSRT